jgi:hypothetical protein
MMIRNVGGYVQVPTFRIIPSRQKMSAHAAKCRRFARSPGPRPLDLCQHAHDVVLDPPDVGLDRFQRAPRDAAVEVDLVADEAHAAVFGIALAGVDPGVRHVGRAGS